MNADIAQSVIDDVFETLGLTGCTYRPPSGDVIEDVVILLHRPNAMARPGAVSLGRGGLQTNLQGIPVLVRAEEVPSPVTGGVFTAEDGRAWTIGEAPVQDDSLGLVWRCPARKTA